MIKNRMNLLLVYVALGTTTPETAGSEEGRIARVVAVRLAPVLSVASRLQRFVAFLTAQTRAVPILAERGFPLGWNKKRRKMNRWHTIRSLGWAKEQGLVRAHIRVTGCHQ